MVTEGINKEMLGVHIKKILFLLLFFLLISGTSFSFASEVLVLKSADIKPYNEALEGFKSSCKCSVEEIVYLDSEHTDIPIIISEIKPDAVFAIGMDALTHALAIKDIPVVYVMVPYSYSVPNRNNISGISMYVSAEKYLKMIKEVFPKVKRIGLIYNSENSGRIVKEASQRADIMGFQLLAKKADSAREIPGLIDSMKNKVDLYWMLPDMSIVNSETFNYMLMFSFLNEIPVVTFSKKYVEMGASAGLSIDTFDIGVQAGEMMRRILKANSPGAAEIRDASKTVLTINKKVVRKLGINIRDDIKGAEYVE